MLFIIVAFFLILIGMSIRMFVNKDIIIAFISVIAVYIIATFISNIFVFLSILSVLSFYIRIFYIKDEKWFKSCKKQIDKINTKFNLSENKLIDYIIEVIDIWINKLYMPINHNKKSTKNIKSFRPKTINFSSRERNNTIYNTKKRMDFNDYDEYEYECESDNENDFNPQPLISQFKKYLNLK